MRVNENSILAAMNPFALLGTAIIICMIGWFCANRYRNTNDFAKSVKLFIPFIVLVNIILYSIANIPVILFLGVDICGFITMSIVSNYYFYH